jgi:hypothetical protein
MIDVHQLFELVSKPRSYDSLDAELKAVASREKGMSAFVTASKVGDVLGDTLNDYLQRANVYGLVVASQRSTKDGLTYEHIVAMHPDQAWRLPAYLAIVDALNYEWSDAAEYICSVVLGYSAESIDEWLSWNHSHRAGWRGSTIYLVMSSGAAVSIGELAGRGFPRNVDLASITAVIPSERMALRKDAWQLVPEGSVMARIAVKEGVARRIFDQPEHGGLYVSNSIEIETLDLNKSLLSGVEFQGPTGWSRE